MNHSNHVVSSAITAESIAESNLVASDAVALYALGLGDDALILAQRLGEWIAHAPELEEDVALGNIGLDQLGHARSFLTYAGTASNRSEDDLAYFRTESEFRNRQIFEQPNGDFAVTIARQFFVSLYFVRLYRGLSASTDPTLAAIAAKATREVDYHLDHSVQWLLRLGLGTPTSHEKMQHGVDVIWPYVGELFSPDPALEGFEGVGVEPEGLRESFDREARRLLEDAGLEVPTIAFARGGGRDGIHTEAFGHLLAEMQVLARAHPGATW